MCERRKFILVKIIQSIDLVLCFLLGHLFFFSVFFVYDKIFCCTVINLDLLSHHLARQMERFPKLPGFVFHAFVWPRAHRKLCCRGGTSWGIDKIVCLKKKQKKNNVARQQQLDASYWLKVQCVKYGWISDFYISKSFWPINTVQL